MASDPRAVVEARCATCRGTNLWSLVPCTANISYRSKQLPQGRECGGTQVRVRNGNLHALSTFVSGARVIEVRDVCSLRRRGVMVEVAEAGASTLEVVILSTDTKARSSAGCFAGVSSLPATNPRITRFYIARSILEWKSGPSGPLNLEFT